MIKINTPSFNLAAIASGDKNSPQIALVLPGLLDTKDYRHIKSHADFLGGKGFYSLSFDPPGTWESEGDISLYTMTNYLKAINEMIAIFDNKPTFVIGHSLGGRMAMLAAVDNPNVTAFTAIMSAISFIRISNFEQREVIWGQDGFMTFNRELPYDAHKKKQFVLPYSFSQDTKNHDAAKGLTNLSKPKLFILGKRDITVTPQEAKDAYDLAAEPKKLLTVNSDHDYRRHPKTIDEINAHIGDFLKL